MIAMNYKLDKGSHSVYALQYHLVQCVKYRKKALVSESITDFLKEKVREISETFQVNVLNIECDKDGFAPLVRSAPKV